VVVEDPRLENEPMKPIAWMLTALPLLLSAPLQADDLHGSANFLCTTLESHVCAPGGCNEVDTVDLNVPRFILIDADAGTLATTAASGENRQTTSETVSRADDRVLLQGFENDRAFSLLIDESSGEASFAAAGFGVTITAFGVCTPTPGK
jgi:hypothetical protein